MDYYRSKPSKWDIYLDEMEDKSANILKERTPSLASLFKSNNDFGQSVKSKYGTMSTTSVNSSTDNNLCNRISFDFSRTPASNCGFTLKDFYPSLKHQPLEKQHNDEARKIFSPSFDLTKYRKEKENREKKENDEMLENLLNKLADKKRTLNLDVPEIPKKVKLEHRSTVGHRNQLKDKIGNVCKVEVVDRSITKTVQRLPETSRFFEKEVKNESSMETSKFLEKFKWSIENLSNDTTKIEHHKREIEDHQHNYQQVKPEISHELREVDNFSPNLITKGDNHEATKIIDLAVADLSFDQDLEEEEEKIMEKANKAFKNAITMDEIKPLTSKKTENPPRPDLYTFDIDIDDYFCEDVTEEAKPAKKNDHIEESKFFNIDSAIEIKLVKRITVETTNSELPKELTPVDRIPAKFRNVFSNFQNFNLAQTKVFEDAFNSDKTMVISAPTGSGKTAIFELAITRLLNLADLKKINASFKVVYIAPLKTLCHERYCDWQKKFSDLGLGCVEMTGDSEDTHYRLLDQSSLIFATPEKWDGLVRLAGFNKLVASIKLILIDEVHLLGDKTRGPKLEAIITRFKIIQQDRRDYRFIAVSATAPNSADIAQWLGEEANGAVCYNLDDRFRAVKLTKKVIGYACPDSVNDFLFLQKLNWKLPALIKDNSKGRPTLIFVCTRKDSQTTAEFLAKDSSYCYKPDQKNAAFMISKAVADSKLKAILPKGVGFHHAGLAADDRHKLEVAFLNGNIPVLVATSTLAMGVNFPAHLVIIKGTGHYVNGGFIEYGESEILQMMGRAGRPQFDTHGCAIILTKGKNETKYKKLVSGEKVIESSIHEFLADIFMAEIERRTISCLSQALEWVQSTFFHIRVHKNKQQYGLDPNWTEERVEQKLKDICVRELNGLKKYGLIEILDDCSIKATEIGRMMAVKTISYPTMCHFLELKGDESLCDLLTVLAKCRDLNRDVTLRNTEKKHLNQFNARSKSDPGRIIRFPMSGRIKTKEMKINVLIQAVLSCIPFPKDSSLHQETGNLIKISQRLSRVLVDVAFLKATNLKFLLNCVILAKCLRAGIWENSKYVSKQIPRVGLELSSRMADAGLTTFDKIVASDPRNIEMFCRRNVTFGEYVIKEVKRIPKYNVTVERHYKSPQVGYPEAISIKVHLLNWETVKNDPHKFENHSCVLLIGDQTNKILEKKKILDKFLINGKGIFEKILTVPSSASSILVHFIDEFYVGTDVSIEYFPKYLLTNEREIIRRIPTINHCDNIFKLSAPQTKRSQKASKCATTCNEAIEVTDSDDEEEEIVSPIDWTDQVLKDINQNLDVLIGD